MTYDKSLMHNNLSKNNNYGENKEIKKLVFPIIRIQDTAFFTISEYICIQEATI